MDFSQHWRTALRAARKALNLSQTALAQLARVSPGTVRSYEGSRRSPTRRTLERLLDALKMERGERNRVLMEAGFAPDGLALRPSNEDLMYSRDEAAREIERYAWPAFVLDEMMEVVAANRVAQRLWGVDLRREFTTLLERNLLGVASNPRFADRCANWDEAVGVMISVFKGHHRGPENLEQPSAYFHAVFEEFQNGDPKYVGRFGVLWEKTQPAKGKIRWSYPVVWDEPGIGKMRFHCFASSANEWDGLSFNDWIPLDAATWQALEALAPRRP